MRKEELQAISAKAREEILVRREQRLERARVRREKKRARLAEARERARQRLEDARAREIEKAIDTINRKVESRARRGYSNYVYKVGVASTQNRDKASEIASAFPDLDGRVSVKKERRVSHYDYWDGDYSSYYTVKYVRVVVSW